jgi:MoxR-like ATPase
MNVKNKIENLLAELNSGIYEKEEAIALSLLSSIAGESIFLLGPPGVAKSLIARRLKYAYQDAKVFEYLMSRFSTPDEIFGPVSISKLKDKDKYERIVDNYLPSATVVFLDEIWKAGPSIQNTLLTVLNEKIFRNGEEEIPVPIKALISASNELPAKDQGLEALWDRFLVRLVVEGIEDKEKFHEMTEMSRPNEPEIADSISEDEYHDWSKKVDSIKIPDNVRQVIDVIRDYIARHNQKEENAENQMYASDRRWRKIVRLLRTSAFLNDRTEVDLMDCFLIKHCIWNEQAQTNTAFQFVVEAIEKHGYVPSLALPEIEDELKEIDEDVKEWTKGEKSVKVPKEYGTSQYYKVMNNNNSYNFIKIDDMNKLVKDTYTKLKIYHSNFSSANEIWLKKSTSINKIFVSVNDVADNEGTEYDIECEMENKLFPYINPVHLSTIKEWDKQIEIVLNKAANLRSQIESYKTNDLKHIHVNLFVDKFYADSVEKNINDTEKEIEKFEIESRRIQTAYQNIGKLTDDGETKLIEQ